MIGKLCDIGLSRTNPDSTILICDSTFQMSIRGNYIKGALASLHAIEGAYYKKSEYQKALPEYQKEMLLCVNPKQKATVFARIGNTYNLMGDYVLAAQNFYSGIRELENNHIAEDDAPAIFSDIYMDMGLLNADLLQYDNTIMYLNKAEIIARKGKAYTELANILLNKSTYYHMKSANDSAMKCLSEVKSLIIKYKFKEKESTAYGILGTICLNKQEYEKAIDYFNEAIDPNKLKYENRPAYIKFTASTGIATALYAMKKYQKAESILFPEIEKATQLNLKTGEIIEAYSLLIRIYNVTKQYKKGFYCMNTLMELTDSLNDVDKMSAVNKMEIKYKTAEKDKLLSQNQLLIAQQKNKIVQKNIWMISIASGFILLLLISTVVYIQTRNRQRSLDKESKISVLKAAVEGGDNERTRIARELHDGIGGMLSAAMMRFSSMPHEKPEIAGTAAYRDTMGILREMGDEIRKTAHNLMPEVLLKQSLPEAVRIFCNNAREEGAMDIDFQSYGSFDNLSHGPKLNLYRIIQELIKNASLHSDATKVLVQLLQNENKLIVSVEDNGKGFNTDEIKGGLGLHNIRTRVSSMDGHFTLESKPGKGTTVIIELENPELKITGEV